MIIEAFGFDGFRSYGIEHVRFGPLNKINYFIGQNNTGKSNILLFLAEFYEKVFDHAKNNRAMTSQRDQLDGHIGNSASMSVSFGTIIGGEKYLATIDTVRSLLRGNATWVSCVEKIFKSRSLTCETNVAWFRYAQGINPPLHPSLVDEIISEKVVADGEWYELWTRLTGQSGGSLQKHWVPETLQKISPVHYGTSTKVRLVPAIRKVGDHGTEAGDFSGLGIIDRLAQLQNPPHDRQDLKQDFDGINTFLQTVTGKKEATIEIPYKRDVILVKMDKKILPLSHLGTGIHEVIILAAASTILRDQVVCVEEPELHLHPLLQKKLVNYLSHKTSNQYFISTHSAHLLDTPESSIFHIRNQDGTSKVEFVSTDSKKSSICADLGYRGSDLLQANCVIWVEGPTDRLYLNSWIKALDATLIEGVHYSIMFYGGRLLSHLSVQDEEVTEFIRLRRLNRHIAIVIDSDRDTAEATINATKNRVTEEFNGGSGFAWVTNGREIENYIESNILEEAIKRLYPDAKALAYKGNIYKHALHFKADSGPVRKDADKVKVAHEVCRTVPNLDVLDLRSRMTQLLTFIREANHVESL